VIRAGNEIHLDKLLKKNGNWRREECTRKREVQRAQSNEMEKLKNNKGDIRL
jgi:hypothetical protein